MVAYKKCLCCERSTGINEQRPDTAGKGVRAGLRGSYGIIK